MAPNVATIKITENVVLPLRIFVNRKQIIQNNARDSSFHTPLLSNNSIVYIKSPSNRIYLSNHDMQNLCLEIKADLLLLLYELSSTKVRDGVLKNLRIGQTLDFQKDVLNTWINDEKSETLTSHIQTIKRVAKFKMQLHFKKNWELDIFISNFRKLTDIRTFLLLKECGSPTLAPGIYSRRRILLLEKTGLEAPKVLPEEWTQQIEGGLEVDFEEDEKPELAFNYNPVISLGECIDIHVLHRPKRKREAKLGQ